MSRSFRRLQNSRDGSLPLSACLCLSKPEVSQQYQELLFLFVLCLCPDSDWWYLSSPVTVCTCSFWMSCPLFCNIRTLCRYKHVHTPLVSRYPVFSSPVTPSSWYCLSDSSWFVWVSVVTAQRPVPGDPDLSALSESWNQRWMAGSHLCPELCALLLSPAALHSLSHTLLLNRAIVGSLVLQKMEPNVSCYLILFRVTKLKDYYHLQLIE